MKKYSIVFLTIFFILLFMPSLTFASQDISVKIEAGFNNRVKMNSGYPLKATITNNGLESFSGDLVIHFPIDYSNVGAKIISVNVEAKETKTYEVSMTSTFEPYQSSIQDQNVFLYSGSWKKGKKIDFSGDKYFSPYYFDINQKTVGILSENPDRLNPIKGNSVYYFNLNKDNMPEKSEALSMLDIIIIDEFAVSSFSKEQTNALKEWVNNGGTLIVGATTNAQASYGDIYSLLPMKLNQETKLDSLDLSSSGYGSVILKNVQLFYGEFEKDAVALAENNIPIILNKDYGNGQIFQTAFSLGDEPNMNTEGFPAYLVNIIEKIDHSRFQAYSSQQLYWSLGEPAEIFINSSISVGQLVLILLIYLIIIVPVLYFILKKIDKREAAWWIIPSISIVTSLLIFGIGAKDRISNPKMNELGVYVSNQNNLMGYYSVAFQSNTGGEYTLTVQNHEYMPIPTSSVYSTNLSNITHFQDKRNETDIIFPNVEYWSIRSLIGKSSQTVSGSFTTDLTVVNKELKGTITNQYPYNFDEIFIWTGQSFYSLGPVNQGETINVNVKVYQNVLTSPSYNKYSSSTQDLDFESRASSALITAASDHFIQNIQEPVIAGYTSDQVIKVEMVAKNVSKNRKSLILQPFIPNTEIEGAFNLSSNDMNLELNVVEGSIGFDYTDQLLSKRLILEKGTYHLIYKLPKALIQKENIKFEELSFQNLSSNIPLYLINQVNNEKLLLNDSGGSFQITENVNQYISSEGSIMVEFEIPDDSYPTIALPELSMKGNVES